MNNLAEIRLPFDSSAMIFPRHTIDVAQLLALVNLGLAHLDNILTETEWDDAGAELQEFLSPPSPERPTQV